MSRGTSLGEISSMDIEEWYKCRLGASATVSRWKDAKKTAS
jgi:hypothetical protein